MAAMAPERSRNLHNFSLPPRLNWGSQRLLRCSKLNNNNNTTSNSNNFTSSSNDDVSVPDRKRRNVSFRSPPPPPSSIRHGDNHQIGVMREKLMYDLCSEVDQIRADFLGNSEFAPPPPPESRPWNLRTRRSPATAEVTPPIAAAVASASVSSQRGKFSVPLSRQEIEDDFVHMSGKRPPRKPKKRPRSVQKYLDNFYPGLWLEEITADMYKVQENPELVK